MEQEKLLQAKLYYHKYGIAANFVNADSIAAGISSFNPDGVALEAAAEMYWYWEMVMADLKGLRQVYCWKN